MESLFDKSSPDTTKRNGHALSLLLKKTVVTTIQQSVSFKLVEVKL